MPLYYFDLADNGAVVTDDFGVELEDLFEAREQAIALLPDMARDELPDGERHEFSAVVRCEDGRVRYVAKLVFTGRWVEPPPFEPASASAAEAASAQQAAVEEAACTS